MHSSQKPVIVDNRTLTFSSDFVEATSTSCWILGSIMSPIVSLRLYSGLSTWTFDNEYRCGQTEKSYNYQLTWVGNTVVSSSCMFVCDTFAAKSSSSVSTTESLLSRLVMERSRVTPSIGGWVTRGPRSPTSVSCSRSSSETRDLISPMSWLNLQIVFIH